MTNKKNSIIVSLFVLAFLGIFFMGVSFGDFTGNVARENEKGILKVVSFPEGASVSYYYVESQETLGFGVTPFSVAVTQGHYILKTKLDGYDDITKRTAVIGGQTTLERFQLESSGKISIISIPKRAKVNLYLNGKLYDTGETPFANELNPRKVPSGKYELVVEMDGYKKFVKNLEIKSGEVVNINAKLELIAVCNDGRQNGNEEGIDCGGSCYNTCEKSFI